ncbi:hypothetical protein QEP13_17570 [Enterobacter ludwigii]|jgi:hypothetical protein|uniref:hypothetical protein n=1 Tax=Enterobacter TaxID=547 RepID=UPI0010133B6D|nr:hypothetical protein [Enterobacter cloacae]
MKKPGINSIKIYVSKTVRNRLRTHYLTAGECHQLLKWVIPMRSQSITSAQVAKFSVAWFDERRID